MKNLYVLVLKTNEEKPYNKFCHLVTKHIEDKLEWLDIVSENFPKVTIKGTLDIFKSKFGPTVMVDVNEIVPDASQPAPSAK